jgi:hypothetical protein
MKDANKIVEMPYVGNAGREGRTWKCSAKHVDLFRDYQCRTMRPHDGLTYVQAFPCVKYAKYSDAESAHMMIAHAEWPDERLGRGGLNKVVHHWNGDGEDNTIENLCVMHSGRHRIIHSYNKYVDSINKLCDRLENKGIISKITSIAILNEISRTIEEQMCMDKEFNCRGKS